MQVAICSNHIGYSEVLNGFGDFLSQFLITVCRRDALRFPKAIDEEKFADGIRQALSDDEISMAFWLSTGLPPQLRLRDLRARDRGALRLDLDCKSWMGYLL